MITRGKDKGETGILKRVIRSQNRVIVESKNLVRDIIITIWSFCFSNALSSIAFVFNSIVNVSCIRILIGCSDIEHLIV